MIPRIGADTCDTENKKEMSFACKNFYGNHLEAFLAARMAILVTKIALTIQANIRLQNPGQHVGMWLNIFKSNHLLTVIKRRTGTWNKMTLGPPSAKKQ